jgi:ComEC/Rec2-related protein
MPRSAGALVRLWLAVAAFAAGTAQGLEARPPWVVLALGGLGASGLLRRRSPASVAGLVAAVFALGWSGAAQRTQQPAAVEALAASVSRCKVRGGVLESAGGLGTLVALGRAECEGWPPVERPGVVVLDGMVGDPGSPLWAEGWLLPLSSEGFDTARWRVGARAYLDAEAVRWLPPTAPLPALAASVRGGLARAATSLPPERAALLRGLAIGDTRTFDASAQARFRRAGLAHLVAVSGSNVAIVLGAVALGLGPFAPLVRLGGALSALVMFVLVVGPEPSVLRAAAMGAVGAIALFSGRRAEPLHALGLALIFVVALRPGLVSSVGLHLSAAATAGIVLWARPLAGHLGLAPRPVALGLGATLAAQLAVAPLVIIAFGELSVVGPLANLLAMPAVPPATVMGLGAAVAGALYEPAGGLLARAAEPFVAWIMVVGNALGAAPLASIELAGWAGWVAAVPLALCAFTAAVSENGESTASPPAGSVADVQASEKQASQGGREPALSAARRRPPRLRRAP